MVSLSILDSSLLVYKYEDWRNREPHCISRFEALTLHREEIQKYDQKMAMSDEFRALMYQSFPYRENYRSISELRDFRGFIYHDLQKAHNITPKDPRGITLGPTGIVCEYIDAQEVVDAWKGLLYGCLDEVVSVDFDAQVATWETLSLSHCSEPKNLTVQVSEGTSTEVYRLPLIWDDDSWATQLVTQDWWPDLHRCVELHFKTSGLRSHSCVRERPVPFECTRNFRRSLDQCTSSHLRHSLIRALTKMVYGVHDAGLSVERLGTIRRFRVTAFWRVHCREEGGRLVFEEFGPHGIGGIG